MEEYKKSYEQDCELDNVNQHIPIIKNFTGTIYAFGDIHGDLYLVIQILLAINVISFTANKDIFGNHVTLTNDPHIKKIYEKSQYKYINRNENLNRVLQTYKEFRDYFYKHFDMTRLKGRYFTLYLENIEWTTDNVYVIQTGDIIDSFRPNTYFLDKYYGDSPDDINILILFKHLNVISKGRMVNLLGNHELLNIANDYTYVSHNNLLNITDVLSSVYIIHLIYYIQSLINKEKGDYFDFTLNKQIDPTKEILKNITDKLTLVNIKNILIDIYDNFYEIKNNNYTHITEIINRNINKVKEFFINFLDIIQYYNNIKDEDDLKKLRYMFFRSGDCAFSKKMACFMYSTFMINDIIFVHAGIVKDYLEKIRRTQKMLKENFYNKKHIDNIIYFINLYFRRLIINVSYEKEFINETLLDNSSPFVVRDTLENFNKEEDLKFFNIGKMIVGHTVHNTITERDNFIIYIDVGMSNSVNRVNNGEILKINNNKFTIITLENERPRLNL